MPKHEVIAMKKVTDPVGGAKLARDGKKGEYMKAPLKLPEGCTGILYAFESKKAATNYFGKNISFVRIEDDHG